MNFNNDNYRKAGPIKCNPMNGLCERASIQCEKILDMGIAKDSLTDQTVALSNIEPATLVAPFTFVSGTSTSVSVEDLVITRLASNTCQAHVQCNLEITISFQITDSQGVSGTATGVVTIPKNVILFVGEDSIMNYEIGASVSAVVTSAEYVATNNFVINLCYTSIIKSLLPVELVVPSYGYSIIPPEQPANINMCNGEFAKPLYPNSCGYSCCNPSRVTINNLCDN